MSFINTVQFAGIRAVKLLFRQFLEILDELKVENNSKIEDLEKTLSELEEFIKKEHGISISLKSYIKYANIFDENKMKMLRKRVLDSGNALIREIETQR